VSTKIGLISDIHANSAPLAEAVDVLGGAGAELILCAGDVAGYGVELEQCVRLLADNGCRTVMGNHDLWYLETVGEAADPAAAFLRSLPSVIELTIEGRTLYMVHASPPRSYDEGIRLLDESGALIAAQTSAWGERLAGFEQDILVVGHTHQVFAQPLGGTLVINPGSTWFNHTCALLSLPECEIEFFALSNQAPVKAWHWGVR